PVGTAYKQTITASGGMEPYTFAVSSGNLPAGLTLSGGVLSGTPTASGAFSFSVTATDAAGCSKTQDYAFNGGNSSDCVPRAGLIGWYRAENTADDGTGTNPGTLQSGTTFADGKVGRAFS